MMKLSRRAARGDMDGGGNSRGSGAGARDTSDDGTAWLAADDHLQRQQQQQQSPPHRSASAQDEGANETSPRARSQRRNTSDGHTIMQTARNAAARRFSNIQASRRRSADASSGSNKGQKRRTWRAMLLRHFGSRSNDYKVFGEELSLGVRRTALSDNIAVPAVLRRCILFVQQQGLQQEGIYRKPASHAHVEKLKSAFEQDGDVDLGAYFPHPSANDVNTAGSLLKLYLRNLPEPVLTDQLKHDFQQAATAAASSSDCVQEVTRLLQQLPRCNYLVLGWLFKHLYHVMSNSRHNCMSFDNLYIVFSPTLSLTKEVMIILMDHVHALFPDVELLHCPSAATRHSSRTRRGRRKGARGVKTEGPLQPMPSQHVLSRTEQPIQLLTRLSRDIIALEKALVAHEAEVAVYASRGQEYPTEQQQQMADLKARLETDRQCYQRVHQRVPGWSPPALDAQLIQALRDTYTTLALEHQHLQATQMTLLKQLYKENTLLAALEAEPVHSTSPPLSLRAAASHAPEKAATRELAVDSTGSGGVGEESPVSDDNEASDTPLGKEVLQVMLKQLAEENRRLSTANTSLLESLSTEADACSETAAALAACCGGAHDEASTPSITTATAMASSPAYSAAASGTDSDGDDDAAVRPISSAQAAEIWTRSFQDAVLRASPVTGAADENDKNEEVAAGAKDGWGDWDVRRVADLSRVKRWSSCCLAQLDIPPLPTGLAALDSSADDNDDDSDEQDEQGEADGMEEGLEAAQGSNAGGAGNDTVGGGDNPKRASASSDMPGRNAMKMLGVLALLGEGDNDSENGTENGTGGAIATGNGNASGDVGGGVACDDCRSPGTVSGDGDDDADLWRAHSPASCPGALHVGCVASSPSSAPSSRLLSRHGSAGSSIHEHAHELASASASASSLSLQHMGRPSSPRAEDLPFDLEALEAMMRIDPMDLVHDDDGGSGGSGGGGGGEDEDNAHGMDASFESTRYQGQQLSNNSISSGSNNSNSNSNSGAAVRRSKQERKAIQERKKEEKRRRKKEKKEKKEKKRQQQAAKRKHAEKGKKSKRQQQQQQEQQQQQQQEQQQQQQERQQQGQRDSQSLSPEKRGEGAADATMAKASTSPLADAEGEGVVVKATDTTGSPVTLSPRFSLHEEDYDISPML